MVSPIAAASFPSRNIIGLTLGILLFFGMRTLPTPSGLTADAHTVGALTVLMAVWWISECLPIAVTALVPFVAYPILTDLSPEQVAAEYGNPTIFLMMGGFMIALAMQRWQLHRRIALLLVKSAGTQPRRLLGGFMLASAGLSMWVSNTATVVMLVPIATAVVAQAFSHVDREQVSQFGESLLLGVAYAASVGGVATLIGSPPNLIFQGQARALLGNGGDVQFVQWFVFAFPLSALFLTFIWGYLGQRISRSALDAPTDPGVFSHELQQLGSWTRGERVVLTVFLLTAVAWITKSDLVLSSVRIPGWNTLLGLPAIHDGAIAIAAALLLFGIPVDLNRGVFALDWDTAKKLPWEVVLLMGGGFALAEAFRSTGLAEWLGTHFILFQHLPLPALLLALCILVTFITEVTSNTATAVVLMPILASAAMTMGIDPFLLMVPATVSCSFAFMLPVATPPNAVVFGSGYVRIQSMTHAGWVLNLVGALLTTIAMLGWGRYIFRAH